MRLTVRQERYCRTNRMPWPSWQDLYKAFNAAKREEYPFVMEGASRVQEGAFKDFGAALRNWRDPSHPAGQPRFRKRRRTGAGSSRAASGVAQLRHDGKRRIRLPVIGSVKLAHRLPEGIPYEAHISYRNGRWVLSVKFNKFQSLVIEDLNVKGMMSGLTPKAQADAGMGEIRRQLLYKGEWHHCKVVLAGRYYPSSKTCSASAS